MYFHFELKTNLQSGFLILGVRIIDELFGNGDQPEEFVRGRGRLRGDPDRGRQIQRQLLVAVVEQLAEETFLLKSIFQEK